MKISNIHTVGSAALSLLSAHKAAAHGSHGSHRLAHLERRFQLAHNHHPLDLQEIEERDFHVVKRNSQGEVICELPDDPDLVKVPGEKNAGFAMAPDVECVEGQYCPISCKSGKVMAQWDPDSDTSYPASMNGGLLCKSNGKAEKPFKDEPYCVDGAGTVTAVNKCGKELSFCQTVYPGDEGMYIKTVVSSSATLAVPDPDYWQSTSAHFYVNPPGVGEEGCIWGSEDEASGNWSPYVAGANQDSSGKTFVTLGYNPVWQKSSLSSTTPSYGVKIECPEGGCNGDPCGIDPSENDVGSVSSDLKSTGAGDAEFCVVTVPKGAKANIIVYSLDGSGSDDSDEAEDEEENEKEEQEEEEEEEQEEEEEEKEEEEDEPETSTPPSTTSPEPEPTPEAESSYEPSSEQEPETTPVPSLGEPTTGLAIQALSSKSADSSSSEVVRPSLRPAVFHENNTAADTSDAQATTLETAQSTPSAVSDEQEDDSSSSDDDENDGVKHGSPAFAGLVIAVMATLALY